MKKILLTALVSSYGLSAFAVSTPLLKKFAEKSVGQTVQERADEKVVRLGNMSKAGLAANERFAAAFDSFGWVSQKNNVDFAYMTSAKNNGEQTVHTLWNNSTDDGLVMESAFNIPKSEIPFRSASIEARGQGRATVVREFETASGSLTVLQNFEIDWIKGSPVRVQEGLMVKTKSMTASTQTEGRHQLNIRIQDSEGLKRAGNFEIPTAEGVIVHNKIGALGDRLVVYIADQNGVTFSERTMQITLPKDDYRNNVVMLTEIGRKKLTSAEVKELGLKGEQKFYRNTADYTKRSNAPAAGAKVREAQ